MTYKTKKQSEDERKINDWLAGRVLNRECPLCHARSWKQSEDTAALASLAGNGADCSRAFVPVVPVYCEECGLVLPISMTAMGITTPYPERIES